MRLFQDGVDLGAMIETKKSHISTATPDMVGKGLRQYSLETVKMFYEDARAAGFKLV